MEERPITSGFDQQPLKTQDFYVDQEKIKSRTVDSMSAVYKALCNLEQYGRASS